MIMVSSNETFKKILNPSGEMNVGAYVASGAMAGAVVRTRHPLSLLVRWEHRRRTDAVACFMSIRLAF